jgi:stringent starvation protein B
MQSTKPYLIRALHEWCADKGFTPYLAVAVDETTRVPREFVKDGEIVLNIGHEATHQLQIGNEEITFQARFSGRAFPVFVPIERVAAIYAKENGEGMAFEVTETAPAGTAVEDGPEGATGDKAPATSTPKADGGTARPFLTRIK